MSVGCPWCTAPGSVRFEVPGDWAFPDRDQAFAVRWCAACAYGWVTPRPQLEDVAAAYPDGYYTHAKTHTPQPPTGFWSRLRQHLAWRWNREQADDADFLLSWLAAGAQPTLCDLGCGNGQALQPYCAAGMRVVGVEPDERARAVASGVLSEVFAGTAEQIPAALKGRPFDAVRLCHVLEHCLDPVQAVREAVSLLKPGGVLFLETPNSEARGFVQQQAAWPWTDIPRHLNFFTAASLRQACEAHGLQVEAVDYRGFARQVSEHWLDLERAIAQRLRPGSAAPRVVTRAWGLVLGAPFRSRARNYDSVWLVARRSSKVDAAGPDEA